MGSIDTVNETAARLEVDILEREIFWQVAKRDNALERRANTMLKTVADRRKGWLKMLYQMALQMLGLQGQVGSTEWLLVPVDKVGVGFRHKNTMLSISQSQARAIVSKDPEGWPYGTRMEGYTKLYALREDKVFLEYVANAVEDFNPYLHDGNMFFGMENAMLETPFLFKFEGQGPEELREKFGICLVYKENLSEKCRLWVWDTWDDALAEALKLAEQQRRRWHNTRLERVFPPEENLYWNWKVFQEGIQSYGFPPQS